MRELPPLMTVGESAKQRLAEIAQTADGKMLRMSVKTKGCSGLSYDMSWADTATAGDEVVKSDNITILVDRKATLFLIGTHMEWETDGLNAGFTFKNPNEKARCGCGESFSV